jgi:hypothetical protein
VVVEEAREERDGLLFDLDPGQQHEAADRTTFDAGCGAEGVVAVLSSPAAARGGVRTRTRGKASITFCR